MFRYLGCAMAAAVLVAGTADLAGAQDSGPAASTSTTASATATTTTTTTVSVRIGLAGRNPAGLVAFAKAVSTPGSPQYHHYLSPARAQARFGATRAQVRAVQKWLKASGMHVTSNSPHWIDATGSADTVREAFGSGNLKPTAPPDVVRAVANVAQLGRTGERGMREGATAAITARRGLTQNQHDHPTAHPAGVSGLGLHSEEAVRLPAGVPEHPDVVHVRGPKPHRQAATASCSAAWGTVAADPGLPPGYTDPEPIDVCGYVPRQLRTAYGVDASGLTGSGVTVAVVDAYGSPTMLADANHFAQDHGDRPFAGSQYQETVTPQQWKHTTDGICQSPGDWAGEEALDVETVHGMAPGATVHYFGANSCADEDINATLANIVDTHGADIISSSFGETMHRTDGNIDAAQISQATQLFQYAAAEGIGFYFASGDCGDDSSRTGPGCDPQSARAQTEWPVSSPWVTAVGGTALALDSSSNPLWQSSMGDRRSALSADGKSWVPFPGDFYFGGGGGTSEDFQQPAYQKGVVPDALSHTLGTGAHTTAPMRTLPDVAMNGDLLTAVQVGITDPGSGQYGEISVGGTSAATPMFAATQADGQQAQVASGGKAIGFANPDVYQRATPARFTDVVAHPAGAPATISTVLDMGPDAQGNPQIRLFELGHDQGLDAAPGYDVATGLGAPREEYLNSFKH